MREKRSKKWENERMGKGKTTREEQEKWAAYGGAGMQASKGQAAVQGEEVTISMQKRVDLHTLWNKSRRYFRQPVHLLCFIQTILRCSQDTMKLLMKEHIVL